MMTQEDPRPREVSGELRKLLDGREAVARLGHKGLGTEWYPQAERGLESVVDLQSQEQGLQVILVA